MTTTETTTRRDLLLATGAGAAGVGLWGAGGAASGEARLRVLHGSRDAPAVDVLVDGARVVEGLEYGELTPYLAVAPGDKTVAVVPAGAPAAEAVLTADVTLAANTDYTAAAVGPLAEIQAVLLASDPASAPGTDTATLQVGHLAPGAPAVDVVADGTTLVSGLSFGTLTDRVSVPAGTYTVEVRPTGSEEAVATFEVTLAGGTNYAAFAIETPPATAGDPPGLDLLVAPDEAVAGDGAVTGTALVRVLHAIPDAPAVDVFADGERVLSGVSFGTISDYLEVPAGTRTFAVAPAGAPASEAVLTAEVTLEGDTAYTVAAGGTLAEPQPFVFVDDRELVPDRAKLRLVHLSPDAPAVDVVANGTTLVSGLEFGQATDFLPVPPARYDVEVRPAGAAEAVGSLSVELFGGAVYSAFAIGFATPDEQPRFSVLPTIDATSEQPKETPRGTPTEAPTKARGTPTPTPTETSGDGDGNGY